MRIRGFRKAGINFKPSNGGPRNYIIIAGQSNAAEGTTSVPSELQSDYQRTFSNCPMVQFSTDTTKVAPLNYLDNTTYQDPVQNAVAAMQFYLPVAVQADLGAADLYTVIYSQGDTNLSSDWKSTATIGAHYTGLVNKIIEFKRECFNSDGSNPVCKFMYWDQGEKDGRVLADANNYQTNLTNFINNLRSAIGEASMPIIIGKLNTNVQNAVVNPITYWATIQAAQTAVSEGGGSAISNVNLVDHDNATMETDWIHYTPAGYLTRTTNIITVANAEGYI